ncbi:hypothetical protein [Streptomyces melanogenes]|uniref:Methyltransferase n=1 Tax=Streptomyces melanogenes TaxID=67326 RepID=A0ABZ1XX21_9ACTN|nr:hypothetical protein [Streptomyces melanogenes]
MSDPQHVPQLPQEEIALIRARHERGYEAARQEAASGVRLMRGLGLDLVVSPQVAAPAPEVAEVPGKVVLSEAEGGARVLELGTGCGINDIPAAGQECQDREVAFARRPMDRTGLRRTAVGRMERERDGRPVECVADRLSR